MPFFTPSAVARESVVCLCVYVSMCVCVYVSMCLCVYVSMCLCVYVSVSGHNGLDTADSDLMHHQFRLSLLQWNPGPACKYPTNIVSAACGKFHAVILQEASDHVPHISDQFMAFIGNTDLAILLNKDTFEPDPIVLTFKVDSTSKGTWGMILLIVRGLLRRPSLSGSPTVTFCSVHIHNVEAKKRAASTELLQALLWIYARAQC